MKIYSSTLTGSLDITGSLTINGQSVATGSIPTTSSLLTTASITNATTTFTKGDGSTFALTTNNVSHSLTANSATTATSASYASNALSSSYAITASYALNGGGGGTIDTGSLMVTGSVSGNTLTFTKGDSSTFNLTVDTGSGGGGGGITYDDIKLFTGYLAPVDYAYTASGTTIDVHVSASGHYDINYPSNIGTTNVNVYFYLDNIPNDGQSLVTFTTLAGTGAAFQVRNLVVNPSNLTIYKGDAVNMSSFGTSNLQINRNASLNQMYFKGTNASNPNYLYKKDNTIYFVYLPYLTYNGIYGPYSGSSYGTPNP